MLRGTVSGVPTYADDDWVRLGEAVARRRVRLGMTQDQLADEADVSTNTVRHVEQGGRARMLTLPKMEAALQWEPGSCSAVLEGQQPVEIGARPPALRPEQSDLLVIERPDGLSDTDWLELRELLRGILTSWVAARRR